MMKARVFDIRGYRFQRKDRLLLDANIWLSIYGPIACHDWRTDVYSKSLQRMLSVNSLILLDAFVMSEFINRFARFEYEQLSPDMKPSKFKQYREGETFKGVAQEISVNVRKIIKIVTRCNFDFESADVNDWLSRYETGQLDFTDHLILDVCKSQDLILVTHDGDFKNSPIPILTANNKLLH